MNIIFLILLIVASFMIGLFVATIVILDRSKECGPNCYILQKKRKYQQGTCFEVAPFEIFFICDRKKCTNCKRLDGEEGDCDHTSDIKHARNFRYEPSRPSYWEEEHT